jgi:hypothetical protein
MKGNALRSFSKAQNGEKEGQGNRRTREEHSTFNIQLPTFSESHKEA